MNFKESSSNPGRARSGRSLVQLKGGEAFEVEQLGVRAADSFARVGAIEGVAAGAPRRQSVTTIAPFISGCGPQP